MTASQKTVYDFAAPCEKPKGSVDFGIDGTPIMITKEPASDLRYLFFDSPQRITIAVGEAVRDSVVIGRGNYLGRPTYGTPENAERVAETIANVSYAARGERCSNFGVEIGKKLRDDVLGFMPRSIAPLPYAIWRALAENGPIPRGQEDEDVLRYFISEYIETSIKT